ncbi:ATP-binding cassette domain-containing protein [Paenibacillus thalictri]|uniref:ATP-binding cassette domain-containing protein n=1 Tax=Paenibacillus thalictri TaxID=2527873 RepID=UPI0013EF458C|nr:dipeptide/oligopeptide/nickel ABC transporter ATP-binding protein [Paenibacillus thalictri]
MLIIKPDWLLKKAGLCMLAAQNVQKYYTRRQLFQQAVTTAAVHNVTLCIKPGETIGLVGESGSGKSTLARCMALLEPVTGGALTWHGRDITRVSAKDARELRRSIQLIFQDPVDAINPRLTVERILTEPLYHFGIGSVQDRKDKARQIIERIGLTAGHLTRYPGELSRGQCQRVNIARALMADPQIMICDEVISSLDVSTGAQIVRLLLDLQQQSGYGYLFISHDLARVVQISQRIAVMYRGELVEQRDSAGFHLEAAHPYTRSLIEAVPKLYTRSLQELAFT